MRKESREFEASCSHPDAVVPVCINIAVQISLSSFVIAAICAQMVSVAQMRRWELANFAFEQYHIRFRSSTVNLRDRF